MTEITVNGVRVLPGFLDEGEQRALVEDLRAVVAAAPLFHPVTARGKSMSVRLTSAGDYGWVSDRRGYRYEARHPQGMPWPPIPERALRVWHQVSGVGRAPQCCLVNFYSDTARMGMHQDRDEADFDMPVVSISLGDEALFRVGGVVRGGPTKSVWLRSGDVAILSGEARLAFHGIDRVKAGSSTLLPKRGRINLTMRVVD
ncbi:Alkylated DNA repair protein AlkB [Roseibacterium elongatum DSM 19469]|uniref:Alkylated DNA repair protein AlkB n=1 Tax=Roseicyclus elongatus DSM 19469 TaxID=1294273 RepID=W8SLQ3_9RHOB|nr:alpha-ketoglutarate-dependent dioxygenase AlkB [Roseibacterium elongatum]AHM03440.1 Alkylated DNA repair protein AlkB [Roseibacterium elongatum DSM 19469]